MSDLRPREGARKDSGSSLAVGLTSYAWSRSLELEPSPLEGILALLAEAARLDLKVVQLCENTGVQSLTPVERTRLIDVARRSDIELELGSRASTANELSDAIACATSLSCRLLRVVAWSGSEVRRPLCADHLAGMVREVLPELHRSGTVLAVENYFDIEDRDLVSVVDEVDDELIGVCYDTANSAGLLNPPAVTAALLAPRAVSVHLKDFTVLKHRAGYQITGAPLGKGWLDVSATLALLTRSPRRPRLLLELWVEPGPDKDETARKEQAWLVASLDYARDLLLGDGRSGIPIRPSGRS